MANESAMRMLQEGIRAAQGGNNTRAHNLLMQAAETLADDPQSRGWPECWLWLAWTSDRPSLAAPYLRRLVEEHPENRLAGAAFQWCRAMAEFDPASLTPSDVDEFFPLPPLSHPRVESTEVAQPAEIEKPPLGEGQTNDAFGEPAVAQPAPSPVSVVAADDSPTVRKLVSLTLGSRDWRVVTAEDGYAALQKIAEFEPQLVLTDINMPRINGYQLCRMLKRHPSTRHIAVVMLSANDGVFDKIRGKMVGCNDYLTKPFDPKELLKKVEHYLSTGV